MKSKKIWACAIAMALVVSTLSGGMTAMAADGDSTTGGGTTVGDTTGDDTTGDDTTGDDTTGDDTTGDDTTGDDTTGDDTTGDDTTGDDTTGGDTTGGDTTGGDTTGGDTTGGDTTGDDEDQEEELCCDVGINDGWLLKWDSNPIQFTNDDASVTVTAPDELTNDLNTFLGWKYTVYYYGSGNSDDGSCDAGDVINIAIEEDSYMDVIFTAVWEKETLAVDASAYLEFFVSSDKDAEDAFDWDDKGNFVKFLESTSGVVKGIYDLEKGKFTPNKGEGVTIPKDLKVPAKEGYTFVGWNTSVDGKGTTYKPGDKIAVTSPLTELFAVYEKNDNPGTGDSFNAVPFIAAAVVSLGATAGVLIARKKKHDLAEDAE